MSHLKVNREFCAVTKEAATFDLSTAQKHCLDNIQSSLLINKSSQMSYK